MNTTERRPCNDNEQREAAKPQAAKQNGRFVPGNVGGPGNPYARRVAELRRVMLECVTNQEMEIIVGELMVQAKFGNLAAIKLLFQYVIGKPPAPVDPDTLDLQEVEQYRRAPEPATLTDIVAGRMPADLACDLLRGVLPYVGRIEANDLAETLLNPEPEPDEDEEEGVEPPPERRPQAKNGDDAPARPTTCGAPSANGDAGANASRRRTTPSTAGGRDRPATDRDGRTAPRPPSGA